MLLTFFGIVLFFAAVEHDDPHTDHCESYSAAQHDQVELLGRADKQLKAPRANIAALSEDDQLRLRDNRSPHSECGLALVACGRVECLYVVVGATDTKQSIR